LPYSILIVDDSTLVRGLIRSYIEPDAAWRVCGEAENGKVAVEKVKELHPDVVILDFQMPGMNGIEAARQIGRFCPQHDHGDAHNARLRAIVEGCSGRWHQGSSLKI
jgi:two-component system, chemotaxis family, protein-glutamate methylesterase/glutaminase